MQKTPERQCLGCRAKKAKQELIRVVRGVSGVPALDFKGKLPGRGAYICRDVRCLNKVVKSRALQRQLKVEIDPQLLSELEEQMEVGGSDG